MQGIAQRQEMAEALLLGTLSPRAPPGPQCVQETALLRAHRQS